MITEHSDIFTENYRIFNLPPMASLQGSESLELGLDDSISSGNENTSSDEDSEDEVDPVQG